MRRLEFERPRTRTIRTQPRTAADAVMVLAQVSRERNRLGQERQSLVKRMKRIESRLTAIAVTETKLAPMIGHKVDTPAATGYAAPPPRPASAYAGGMTLQYEEHAMSQAGAYLYGFTERSFQPAPDLRGLRGAPVEVIGFADLAAVVSNHPVQRLVPARSNVEPHHRVVRQVSSQAALVPAAFGHVGDSQDDILAVLRGNYDEIRQELARLAGKCEMGLKVTWNVENIYDHLVRTNRELREARDRAYRGREPSMNEKLQLGAKLEATLTIERQRLTPVILAAFQQVTCDVFDTPPRDEKTICHTALLVERNRLGEFETALRQALTLFDASVAFEYTGPWPPYSFVRLRLKSAN